MDVMIGYNIEMLTEFALRIVQSAPQLSKITDEIWELFI
jgi:hypothetical protein